MTALTEDRDIPYTVESIGGTRSLTPEGFLLCEGVPVGRTGVMQYHPSELRDDDGKAPFAIPGVAVVHIHRMPSEVFDPRSMSSLIGKPVTSDHPPVDVTPDNWDKLAGGVVMNPRRGQGDQSDLLLADLLITRKDLIRDVQSGKREVSCGYKPEYFPLHDTLGGVIPGQGEQKNIIYNHLALVEKGRCGPRCSIGDQLPTTAIEEPEHMATRSKRRGTLGRALDRVYSAFQSKDQKAFDEAMEELETETGDAPEELAKAGHQIEVHNHLPQPGDPVKKADDEEMPAWFKKHAEASDKRFKDMETAMKRSADAAPEKKDDETKADDNEKILGQLEMEAPPGTGDSAHALVRSARDSAFLADSFKDTAAKAEIIAPGIRLPSFDRAKAPVKTFDDICTLRRQTLDVAYAQPQTRPLIDATMSGRVLDTRKMSTSDLRTVFNSVAAMRSVDNNRVSLDTIRSSPGGGVPIARGAVKSIADLNKMADQRFQKKSA